MLLFVGAHPDDELYAAGLLAMLSARGVGVHLLCLTRGEGGSPGNPPVAAREHLGAAREAELRASAAALGVAGVELMGYVDPEPSGNPRKARAPEVDPGHLAGEIAGVARRVGAEAVLTHGSNGEYGHPAHRLVHAAARESTPLYTFNAHAPGVSLWGGVNPDDPADLVFDATPWLEAKIRAFEAHVSQRGIWLRPGGPATTAEYVRGHAFQETFRRVHRHGPDPLTRWLS